MNEPNPRRLSLPTGLLLAGVAVGAIAVLWSVAGGGTHPRAASSGGSCVVPSNAVSGTEAPPATVAQLVTPLGAASTTFTQGSGSSAVYVYCFDVVDGADLSRAEGVLTGLGYTSAPGQSRNRQLIFTKNAAVPTAVSLTVNGDLDVGNAVAGAKGALSITWTDTSPAS